ncbi:phage tail spike protein [Parvimonas sp. D9]|uniref:phage tail spike protein n=1 Tax=Parvimonas sp. D9 TaxID=3110689 RepID=UPI002B46E63C|nr:phage tail spike protein [Parvimonas sp. D9]MEB3059245.1 phage tail spike protein [Parvimonas sp. D9]
MKSGIFLFNNKQELIDTISPEDLTENIQEIELNGLITATAITKYNKEIEKAEYFGVKELNNFWLYKIRKNIKENGMITLQGIHIIFDDLKGQVLRDIRPTKVTAAEAFNKILENSTWKVGVSKATTTSSANFYYKSVLSSFLEALKKWDCEFIPHIEFKDGKILSKTINLYDKISNDNGKWFEYGDELLTVVAETDKDIYTAYIGLGKGEQTEKGYGRKIKFDGVIWEKSKGKPVDKPIGQDFVEIKEATKLWGYPDGTPKVGIVEFSDVEDREELLNKTYLYAKENCRPKLQLKSTVISQGLVEIGETCTIIRNDLNIRYKTRIFKIKKNFLNSDLISFEFGDKVVLSASDRIKNDNEKEEKKQQELESRMESFLKNITNFYFNEDGYNYELKANNEYKLPAGYYSFDKPIENSPTKVVYMGAGKILIADSKNPNGEWKWRTAITPKGIAGEEIVANSITANKLSADVGQSLDLSSNESINNIVKKSVTSEMSKVKVGARNLLPNSYFFDKSKWHTFGAKSIEYNKLNDIEEWGDCESIKFVERNTDVNSNILAFYLFDNLKLQNKDYVFSFDCINFSDFDLKFFLNEYTAEVKETVKSKEQKRVVLKAKDVKKLLVEVLENNQEPVFSIKKLKIEEGTIATTWVPALEDTEKENEKLKQEILNLTTTNSELAKQLNNLELNNLQLKEFIKSSIKQTKESITFDFEKFKQLYQNDKSVFEGKFDDISSYIRFDIDGMEMGKKDGEFKMRLSSKKQSFFMKEKEVAYFSNEELYITDARILRSIRIGNFAFVPRENGNLSFRKVVE